MLEPIPFRHDGPEAVQQRSHFSSAARMITQTTAGRTAVGAAN